MARQILVPLKRSDRLESFLPYIEEIAQPGMKVVLLLQSNVSALKEFSEQLLAIHAGIRPDLLAGRNREQDILEEQRLAERKLLPLCERLKKQGVHVSVNVYAGSLRRVVRRAMQTNNVHLLMRPSRVNRARHYLRWSIPFAYSSDPASSLPVILLQSGNSRGSAM